VLALLLVAPLLGLDNFASAASIGVSSSGWRLCARVCAVFGSFALLAPLVGISVGEAFAASLGEGGRNIGGAVLILIGMRGLISVLSTPDGATSAQRSAYGLRSILLIGLSVSTDTFAAGFGLGLYGVPIVYTGLVTAAATVLMSWAGFQLGGVVGRHIRGWGDGISSAALAVIGAALLGHLI
jgi:putative Mn2+ efflux pump MntP